MFSHDYETRSTCFVKIRSCVALLCQVRILSQNQLFRVGCSPCHVASTKFFIYSHNLARRRVQLSSIPKWKILLRVDFLCTLIWSFVPPFYIFHEKIMILRSYIIHHICVKLFSSPTYFNNSTSSVSDIHNQTTKTFSLSIAFTKFVLAFFHT